MPVDHSPVKEVVPAANDMEESQSSTVREFGSVPDVTKLNRQRTHLEWQLDRLEQMFVKHSTDVHSLKTISDRVKVLALDYKQWYDSILDVVSDDQAQEAIERYGVFDDRVFELSKNIEYQLASQIPLPTTPNPVFGSEQKPTTVPVRARLPEIVLPHFDGNIRDWPAFRDAFQSLIHSSEQLTECDKLHYLAASLTKDARAVIDALEITSKNYDVAWKLLSERYENKYLIVKTTVEALFSISPLRRECADSLSRLVDDFERNLRMLEKEGEKPDAWSTLLVFRLSSLLDPTTLRHWELHRKSTTIPTYKDLVQFVRNHCHVLKSFSKPASGARTGDTMRSNPRVQTIHAATSAVNSVAYNERCKLCDVSKHSVYRCELINNMSVADRKQLVQSKGLCFNCLSPAHRVRQCTSSGCKICQQRHHTLLHEAAPATEASDAPATSSICPPQSLTHCSIQIENSVVLLQTVLVQVEDNHGRCHLARALLDSGAQLNIVTERLTQRLGVAKRRENHRIGGIGEVSVTSQHSAVLRIHSLDSEYKASGKFHVLSKLTHELPSTRINTSSWQIPRQVQLADPSFHSPGPIDLIIGAELYYDVVKEGLIKLSHERVTLQNTAFGWVIAGRVNVHAPSPSSSIVGHVCSTSIEEQLSKFWELESCRATSTLSVEESNCEKQFAATTTRDTDGRFIVQLPKREDKLARLGDSKGIATRRFLALERRLSSNASLKTAYTQFIEEYAELQHMTEVAESDATTSSPSYYLPHHCIVRPDSTTTKLRVVFDASCASDTGTSLNDALMIGPTIQDDLMSILLRFRMSKFALVADIEKMYRQINIAAIDRPLQRILWRNSPTEPIRTFQLNTVTYGTSCAPYLATKTLQVLSQVGASTHPEAATILGRDFYMDDMLTGVNNIPEGQRVCQQLIDLLASGGFCLRKWATNNRQIFEHLPQHLQDERTILNLDAKSPIIKTLGLKWNVSTDAFVFNIPRWNADNIITKRNALSDVAKLFDPIGLVGPVIIQAKLFLQELWKCQITWDEPLTPALQNRWLLFREKLAMLQTIHIPRWLLTDQRATNLQLHCFCDASEKAYGAAIYLRSINTDGRVTTNLITAKSKVAPLADSRKQKRVCLPRLELSAALLLAHSYEKVSDALKLQVETIFWSDSTIVLHWLSATPSRWKTFIANRVSEIQHITHGKEWRHVPGTDNPADIISRGMDADQLENSNLWWHGPDWLAQPSEEWPNTHQPRQEEFTTDELEERPICMAAQSVAPNELFSLRSTFTGLQRLVAWLRRFRHKTNPANHQQRRLDHHLSLEELAESTLCLVRLAQAESFPEDIKHLSKGDSVGNNSPLKLLAPFLQDGLLRVGGRLRHAPIPFDRKHPYILPANHPLTNQIATLYHRTYQHANPQLLIASMRERFWPLRAKNLARRIVHSCYKCYRCRPTPAQQLMGDLPTERVTPTSTFLHTGVDLCGPIHYRHTSRKAQLIKGYVAIFVCMAVKAVHIELVADLSTNAFLAALRRFIGRRGKPALIECDNARNFLGASREIASLSKQFNHQWQTSVIKSCIDDGIQFKFISPRSPNFGGLWEAAVKSFKTHFKPTVGNAILTSDELNTLLIQIEGCLNSRPLTPLSNDPSDLEVLTPGHFLIHRPIVSLAEPSLEKLPFNRLDRWQKVQEFVRRLWKRWSTDYLSGLQQRTKWTKQKDNVKLDTMVLLKEDGLPPSKWCLGRVTQIIKGADDNIRVVIVKTKDGDFKRSISKICVLPTDEPSSSS
ncbi:uncharacterized protein LOC121591419 [Anopheles merus]|uniref:uncharacterized protein LOC121591419 n=1 Tax=Anopheles merus TaxID=30066 RepID=UPI001BE4C21E|nr:uncharacterized protein LOC121591419 [Anopheles merus]